MANKIADSSLLSGHSQRNCSDGRAHMKYRKVKMPQRDRNISMDLGPDCSITPPAVMLG